MEKEKSVLCTDQSIKKEEVKKTWEEIKRELEIYWNTDPRYKDKVDSI